MKRTSILVGLLLLKPTHHLMWRGRKARRAQDDLCVRGGDTWRRTVTLAPGHRVRKAVGEVAAVEHRGISGAENGIAISTFSSKRQKVE